MLHVHKKAVADAFRLAPIRIDTDASRRYVYRREARDDVSRYQYLEHTPSG